MSARLTVPGRPLIAADHPPGWAVPAFPAGDGFTFSCRSCGRWQHHRAEGGAPESGARVTAACDFRCCCAVNDCVIRLSVFGRTAAEMAWTGPEASSHPYADAAAEVARWHGLIYAGIPFEEELP